MMNRATSADIMPVLEEIRHEYHLLAIAGEVGPADTIVASGAAGVRIVGGPDQITVEDRFQLGSVTKTMTATMMATLVEDSKLSWTTTPSDVVWVGRSIRCVACYSTLAIMKTEPGGLACHDLL